MQHILIDIQNDQLFLQCSEIVKEGEVIIYNDKGNKMYKSTINNNNYHNIDLSLPPGEYHLELQEEGQSLKKNFKL